MSCDNVSVFYTLIRLFCVVLFSFIRLVLGFYLENRSWSFNARPLSYIHRSLPSQSIYFLSYSPFLSPFIYTRTYPTLISEVKKALLNKLELQSLSLQKDCKIKVRTNEQLNLVSIFFCLAVSLGGVFVTSEC